MVAIVQTLRGEVVSYDVLSVGPDRAVLVSFLRSGGISHEASEYEFYFSELE